MFPSKRLYSTYRKGFDPVANKYFSALIIFTMSSGVTTDIESPPCCCWNRRIEACVSQTSIELRDLPPFSNSPTKAIQY